MANIEGTTLVPSNGGEPQPQNQGGAPAPTQPQNSQTIGTWDPNKGQFVIPATGANPVPTTTPVLQHEPSQRAFTADDIERARSEEKGKLHSDLEAMNAEIKRLKEAEEARTAAAAEQERVLKEEQERKRVEETDAKTLLQQKEQEWGARFEALQQDLAARDALVMKEREYAELQQYKAQLLQQHGDDIMPHLRDFVTGNTRDEINASVALLIQKTNEIMGAVQEAIPQPQQYGSFGQPVRTASPTGAPSFDPSALAGGTRSITPNDIKNMSMDEYAKARDSLLGATRTYVQQNGPYGN